MFRPSCASSTCTTESRRFSPPGISTSRPICAVKGPWCARRTLRVRRALLYLCPAAGLRSFVGCAMRTNAVTKLKTRTRNVQLPPRARGSAVFLYPDHRTTPSTAHPTRTAYRPTPGHRTGAPTLSLLDPRLGSSTRSPALHVGVTRTRYRLWPTLVVDQASDQSTIGVTRHRQSQPAPAQIGRAHV